MSFSDIFTRRHHREATERETILPSYLDASSCIAIFSTDCSLRGHILSVLKPIDASWSILKTYGELEDLLQAKSLSVLVAAISDTPGNITSPTEEIDCILNFLPRLQRHHPSCQVVLIAAAKLSLQQICRVVAQGIAGFVNYQQTDFAERLLEHVQAAHRHWFELNHAEPSFGIAGDNGANDGLVGSSAALTQLLHQARRAAAVSDAPVIIHGESGTGKQRIAEIIHKLDPKRRAHNFVCVNCAAIAGTLAESELFGHKRGAFTGATEDRLGYFRAAHEGTILLDEISELLLALQPKILRVLQEGLVLPVGSDKEYRVDVRVIASTHRDLHHMVTEGLFRLDLFERLNVIELTVPSLRQRREDIPALFAAFLRKYAHYYPDKIQTVDPQVYDILAMNIGPGNIRELENMVRRILVFKERGGRIEVTDLPPGLIKAAPQQPNLPRPLEVTTETIDGLVCGEKRLGEVLDEYEKFLFTRLLSRGVSRSVLAERLGITRRTLYNKLQKHHLA